MQHLYAWSYEETVERVADSLVLRWFCRVYFQHVPTRTTLLRWAATIRPTTLQALIDRTTVLARQAKVTPARKLRVDSTCVQTTIHYPTDSGLLGDGVRVLSRLVRRAQPLVQASLATVRDAFHSRVRTSRRLLQQIHRARRLKGDVADEQQRERYQHLIAVTRQTVLQTQQVRQALQQATSQEQPSVARSKASLPASRAADRLAKRIGAQFDRFLPVVERTIHQAQRRVLDRQPVVTGGVAGEGAESVRAPHLRGAARQERGCRRVRTSGDARRG